MVVVKMIVDNALNNLELAAWLFERAEWIPNLSKNVNWVGHGPMDFGPTSSLGSYLAILFLGPLDEWPDRNLRFYDVIRAAFPELEILDDSSNQYWPESGILIVGTKNWSESLLELIVQSHAGRTLRVYSEEMLYFYLITGRDPLSASSELLDRFAEGHGALQYLKNLEIGFNWPQTFVPLTVTGNFPTTGLLDKGMLKHYGYSVGKSSKSSPSARRKILKRVYEQAFNSSVYSEFTQSYLDEWGEPNSQIRLRKMADVISSLCKNEKKRAESTGVDLRKSISDRISDLHWLKRQYYKGYFRFDWPDTEVH